jgi:hypothetical protein
LILVAAVQQLNFGVILMLPLRRGMVVGPVPGDDHWVPPAGNAKPRHRNGELAEPVIGSNGDALGDIQTTELSRSD